MVMTSAKASDLLRKLIEYYNLSRCEGIPGDIPIVEVPLDKYDILAIKMAIDSLNMSLKEKIPHGEWIHAEEYDYLDENGVEHFHIKCPNCGFLHDCFDCHTAQYNFCPNCGADMRSSGEPITETGKIRKDAKKIMKEGDPDAD